VYPVRETLSDGLGDDFVVGPQTAAPGGAVQVDPIKPRLKAPVTKRLRLKCGEPLSNCAYDFNMRRYTLRRPKSAATTAWAQ
jgi:hypothetical protein